MEWSPQECARLRDTSLAPHCEQLQSAPADLRCGPVDAIADITLPASGVLVKTGVASHEIGIRCTKDFVSDVEGRNCAAYAFSFPPFVLQPFDRNFGQTTLDIATATASADRDLPNDEAGDC